MNALTSPDFPLYLEPTDSQVKDAVETLGIKEHKRPEGFATFANQPMVKLNTMPDPICTVEELRAWCTLYLRECVEAEACVEEKVLREALDLEEREAS